MNKHVKNFTELFESASEGISTDDLIVLAESGIISWTTVTEEAFANGDLAVIYWVQLSASVHVPVIIFPDGRKVRGRETKGSVTEAEARANELAYGAGAKVTITTNDISSIHYNNGQSSARVPNFLARDTVLAARAFLEPKRSKVREAPTSTYQEKIK